LGCQKTNGINPRSPTSQQQQQQQQQQQHIHTQEFQLTIMTYTNFDYSFISTTLSVSHMTAQETKDAITTSSEVQ
jgi:hypothetical protein